jgi:hypothetical protein
MTAAARNPRSSLRASPICWSMARAVLPSAWRPTSRRTIWAKSFRACLAYIENPAITVDELIEIIPAPDFPTGPLILGQGGARNAYRDGKGSIVMRARHEIEEGKGERRSIVLTSIPFPGRQKRVWSKKLPRPRRTSGSRALPTFATNRAARACAWSST